MPFNRWTIKDIGKGTLQLTTVIIGTWLCYYLVPQKKALFKKKKKKKTIECTRRSFKGASNLKKKKKER